MPWHGATLPKWQESHEGADELSGSIQARECFLEEDRLAVFRQRHSVYTVDMGLYADAASCAEGLLQDDLDATAKLLVAEDSELAVASLRLHIGTEADLPPELIGTLQLAPYLSASGSTPIAVVSRLTVNREHRKTLAAFSLMRLSAELCASKEVQLAFLDCAPHLINLYSGLGFRCYGEVISDRYTGILVPMVLLLGDFPFLSSIRSPLLPALEKGLKPDPKIISAARDLIANSSVVSDRAPSSEYREALERLVRGEGSKGLELLDSLSPEEEAQMLKDGHLVQCKSGDFIIREGYKARQLSLILEGEVSISRSGKEIYRLGPGQVIGEIAFLTGLPRSADVIACSARVQTLQLDERMMRRLIDKNPDLGKRVLLSLSRSLCFKILQLSNPL